MMAAAGSATDVLNGFLAKVVVQIVNPIIYLLSSLALVLFLWGVFEFVRNAGDSEKRAQGQRAIVWGLVGLVVIFGAYGIINIATGAFNLAPVTPITTQG
jgi:uncharacterized membrane protein